MASRTQTIRTVRNDYRCSMERNQGGKYCVRIQVRYPRHAWNLGVYFLASSFDRAMKKLEEGLDFLQRNEEKALVLGCRSRGRSGLLRRILERSRSEAGSPPGVPAKGGERFRHPRTRSSGLRAGPNASWSGRRNGSTTNDGRRRLRPLRFTPTARFVDSHQTHTD